MSDLTAGLQISVREARRIAQPPEFSPAWTDIPYRVISIFPSLALARAGVSPNQITILWTILGLVALAALACRELPLRLAGAILLQASYLLDFVDGEVARLLKRSSRLGVLLDLAGHGLIKTGVFLVIGYHLAATTANIAWLIPALCSTVFLSGGYMLPFCAECAGLRRRPSIAPVQGPALLHSPARTIAAVAMVAFESPGIYAAVLLGTLFDLTGLSLLLYAATTPMWFLLRLLRYCDA